MGKVSDLTDDVNKLINLLDPDTILCSRCKQLRHKNAIYQSFSKTKLCYACEYEIDKLKEQDIIKQQEVMGEFESKYTKNSNFLIDEQK